MCCEICDVIEIQILYGNNSGFISEPKHGCNLPVYVAEQIELSPLPPFSWQKKEFWSGSSPTNLSLAEKDNNTLES